MRSRLNRILTRRGFVVTSVSSVEEVLRTTDSERCDLILAHTSTPGPAEMKMLDEIAARGRGEAVVLTSAFANVEQGVEAMRRGARDFLVKPFTLQKLVRVLERTLKIRRSPRASANAQTVVKNKSGLRRRFETEFEPTSPLEMGSTPLIGHSPAITQLLEVINRVAPTDSTVLITGATGTGKELVARAIHERSQRGAQFVDLNCSALPDSLIESELFGHERGSFTGAHETRGGLFEKASGGTLFLDEVDALGPGAQVKLLRVLQERYVRRVGGRRNIPVDVRIISATNRDLQQAVSEGKFRVDLLYRLRVVPLQLPELRERGNDIELLADYFLKERCEHRNRAPRRFTIEAMHALSTYDWPGNVRELENAVEYALAVGVGDELGLESLPGEIQRQNVSGVIEKWALEDATLAEVVRRYVLHVFERHGGSQTETAAALGIDRRTLYNRLRHYGILPYPKKRLRAVAHLSLAGTGLS